MNKKNNAIPPEDRLMTSNFGNITFKNLKVFQAAILVELVGNNETLENVELEVDYQGPEVG